MPRLPALPSVLLPVLLPVFSLLCACSGGKDSGGTDSAADTACDPARYAEVVPNGLPGWTPQAGCEILCEELPDPDDQGRAYSGCFLDTDQLPICQYGTPCP